MGENAILAHTDTHIQNVSVSKTHIPVYTVLFVMFVRLNLILLCNLVRLTFLIEPAGCFLPEFFHIVFFFNLIFNSIFVKSLRPTQLPNCELYSPLVFILSVLLRHLLSFNVSFHPFICICFMRNASSKGFLIFCSCCLMLKSLAIIILLCHVSDLLI